MYFMFSLKRENIFLPRRASANKAVYSQWDYIQRGSATDVAQCTAVLLPEGRIRKKDVWLGRIIKVEKRKDSEKIKKSGNISQCLQHWIETPDAGNRRWQLR